MKIEKVWIETSKNGVPIRLTEERWAHITEGHPELAGLRSEVLDAVADPAKIVAGGQSELLAVRERERGKFVVTIYREFDDDGFVITAFLTTHSRWLDRRTQLWP